MIDVCGFTLKNVRHPEGREGFGLLCDIVYKGKVVGSCQDYGDGCVSNVYLEQEYREAWMLAQERFYARFPELKPYAFSDDVFVEDLDNFRQDEKEFKKNQKHGFQFLVRIHYADFSQKVCATRTKDGLKKYMDAQKNVSYAIYYEEPDFKIAA